MKHRKNMSTKVDSWQILKHCKSVARKHPVCVSYRLYKWRKRHYCLIRFWIFIYIVHCVPLEYLHRMFTGPPSGCISCALNCIIHFMEYLSSVSFSFMHYLCTFDVFLCISMKLLRKFSRKDYSFAFLGLNFFFILCHSHSQSRSLAIIVRSSGVLNLGHIDPMAQRHTISVRHPAPVFLI